MSEFKDFKKRVPGWCDRVLFATWADGPDGAGEFVRKEDGKSVKRKGAKVEVYRSVQSFTGSDHKPVRVPFRLLSHLAHASVFRR